MPPPQSCRIRGRPDLHNISQLNLRVVQRNLTNTGTSDALHWPTMLLAQESSMGRGREPDLPPTITQSRCAHPACGCVCWQSATPAWSSNRSAIEAQNTFAGTPARSASRFHFSGRCQVCSDSIRRSPFRTEEGEEELAAAREANRRLMNQVNRPGLS